MSYQRSGRDELRARITELELENKAFRLRLEALGCLLHEIGGDRALLRASVICMQIQPYGDMRPNGLGVPLPK